MTDMSAPTTTSVLTAALAPIAEHLEVDALEAWAATAAPELRQRFVTYVGEAVFFRRILDADLRRLAPGSTVLEIGSGVGLLSRLIAAEGHQVIAFEPESAGFSTMAILADVVQDVWRSPAGSVTVRHERFTLDRVTPGTFAFALAANVIEHVPDPVALVADATSSLAPGGHARFVCPNYAFPYEPHFGFPTAFAKRLTGRWHAHAIRTSTTIPDPVAFWDDLSWPTARSLHRALRARGIEHELSRAVVEGYVERLRDPTFLDRKGAFFGTLADALRLPLSAAVRLVPLAVAPVIDLTTHAPR